LNALSGLVSNRRFSTNQNVATLQRSNRMQTRPDTGFKLEMERMAGPWLAQQQVHGDFITLMFSNNVHEIRGYNRGAGAGSGRVVIFLQDDDVPQDGCRGWVRDVVRLFDAHQRLGVVGLKKACYSRWGKCTYASNHEDVKFTDPITGLGFQFVSVADFSPFAVRRAAFVVGRRRLTVSKPVFKAPMV
jgi:hypothetical protein